MLRWRRRPLLRSSDQAVPSTRNARCLSHHAPTIALKANRRDTPSSGLVQGDKVVASSETQPFPVRRCDKHRKTALSVDETALQLCLSLPAANHSKQGRLRPAHCFPPPCSQDRLSLRLLWLRSQIHCRSATLSIYEREILFSDRPSCLQFLHPRVLHIQWYRCRQTSNC